MNTTRSNVITVLICEYDFPELEARHAVEMFEDLMDYETSAEETAKLISAAHMEYLDSTISVRTLEMVDKAAKNFKNGGHHEA